MFATLLPRRLRRVAAGCALLGVAGCVVPPTGDLATVPPIPPGSARFWFYRVFFPDDTGDMPAIAMNGATVGYGLAGTNFYRDMPASQYHLTVASFGVDYYQSQDVAVAPGQQIFVKIASLPSWEESERGRFRRGTYYVMIVPPPLASLELPHTRYLAGN